MRTRILAIMTSAALLLGGGSAQAQSAGDGGANWDAIVQCAKLSGTPARHACMDQVLRDKGVLDSQHELTEARQAFGQDRRVEARAAAPVPAPAPIPAPAPVRSADAVAAPRPAPPPAPSLAASPPELKALQTTIANVRVAADRMLVITTVEGAVWRQLQTIDLRFSPEKGDRIEIEEGALGGHRCKLGSKIFRCQRIG